MDNTRYTYIVARIRSLESNLIDRQLTDRFLGEDAEGILRILKESDYAESFSSVSEPRDFEIGLTNELRKTLLFLSDFAPERELLDLFKIKYDFHNAKVLLKASYFGQAAGVNHASSNGALTDLGLAPIERLKSAVADKDYASLADLSEPLAKAVERAVEAYEAEGGGNGSLRLISIALDKSMWEYSLETAAKYENRFLEGMFQAQIDLTNISTFVRLKDSGSAVELLERALIAGGSLAPDFYLRLYAEPFEIFLNRMGPTSYGEIINESFSSWPEAKSFAKFELLCDNYLSNYVAKARYVFFGIEPMIAYLHSKESEVKLLRTLIAGKISGAPTEKLRDRLRMMYA